MTSLGPHAIDLAITHPGDVGSARILSCHALTDEQFRFEYEEAP